MSIYKNGKLVAGGRQCMPLLSFAWADHILNDPSWLRADTFSWQSGDVYEAVYQHLVDDAEGLSGQSETIAGITVWFVVAADGHKICPATEESNVAAIYNATGVAWYYIIDTANTRFKLPRTKFGVTGLRDTVGKYVEAGLPNITGTFGNSWATTFGIFEHTSGVFGQAQKPGYLPSGMGQGASSTNPASKVDFNASRSSSIYGNSTTVQPKATQMYLYFYVGNFTQTALENTAGVTTEVLNSKADTNFANTDMIDYVVAKQNPSSSNNYTWYRKYKSGWVEQGGLTRNDVYTYTLPIAMANTNYCVYGTWNGGKSSVFYPSDWRCFAASTTQVYINSKNDGNVCSFAWQVCGMAA